MSCLQPVVQGTVTRNALRSALQTAEFDFSALTNLRLSGGKVYCTVTAPQAFNVSNHANFGNPNANISNGNVGTITATSFDNRDLHFTLKLLW